MSGRRSGAAFFLTAQSLGAITSLRYASRVTQADWRANGVEELYEQIGRGLRYKKVLVDAQAEEYVAFTHLISKQSGLYG